MHKVLEDAGVKLSSVASNVLGVSGRLMLEALCQGANDPVALAELARGRLRAKLPALRRALESRFRDHHAFDYADRGSAPLMIVHGGQDTFTPPERAQELAEQARSASANPVVYVELPGAQHSFDLLSSVRFEAVIDGIEAFELASTQDAPHSMVVDSAAFRLNDSATPEGGAVATRDAQHERC